MKLLPFIRENSCFISSLKVVCDDLGIPFEIQSFIDTFPDLCHKGQPNEGAFHVRPAELIQISALMNFDASFVDYLNDDDPDARYLLSFHNYNDENSAHVIVFFGFLADDLWKVADTMTNEILSFPQSTFTLFHGNVVEIRRKDTDLLRDFVLP